MRYDVRRKLANALKFQVPYARYMPRHKLGLDVGSPFSNRRYWICKSNLDTIIDILNKNGVEIVYIQDTDNPKIKFSTLQLQKAIGQISIFKKR